MNEVIERKQFLKGDFEKKRSERDKHPVLLLLKRNRNRAFTAKAICKRVNLKEDTVRSMLFVLVKEKLVLHKTPYYIIK